MIASAALTWTTLLTTPTLAQLSFYWSSWSLPFTHYWVNTACSLLVGVVCGLLGCFVVLRRMALIGDALSHAVLPGVVTAFLLLSVFGIDVGSPAGIISLMIGALVAGMATSGLVGLLGRTARTKEDSAIGIVFTALFALGVILISSLPRGTHFDLKCFLFGEPLAVGPGDLAMLSFVAAVVIAWVTSMYHPLKLASFDPVVAAAMGIPVAAMHYLLMSLLSLTVVAGLTTVGVIMVVAMVVTPASAAYQLTNRLSAMLILSAIFGAVSAVGGLVLAFIVNAPTGPAMVVVATVIFGLCVIGSPRHGVAMEWIRRRRIKRHVESEDILKAMYHTAGSTNLLRLASQLHLSIPRTRTLATDLQRAGLLTVDGDTLALTSAGTQRATDMVRSHRLWERYLADEAKVDPAHVHEQAELLEHVHELADEVDRQLGHPRQGPHGEEIPRGERA
jgi:ABC-type Mn2+/Zn2+ transport system permease subunit/Mn-dependent DtxR family transcriptional regulator